MESANESVCASCGFQNRAEASFCGSCGDSLANTRLCPNCGATISRACDGAHDGACDFCSICGSRVSASRAATTVGKRSAGSTDIPLPRIPSLSLPAWLRSAPVSIRRGLAPISIALLAAGALLVALAQAYLTFAYELNGDAPGFGIFALITGFALFALGAYARSGDDDTPDALDDINIPAPRAAAGKITQAKVAALGFGFIMTALLAFRLLTGSESGWDLLPWLLALGAFSVLFIRISNPPWLRAAIIRKHYADILIALVLVAIFVALNTHDLTDWHYSAIGDEYGHYNFAEILAEDGLRRPFSLDGVYGEINPVMSSIYPAVVMRLLGINNFTWKFSLILSVALAIPGVYILGHIFAGRIAAFVASAILAFSHYIFAFMHVGYPNTDVLPIIVWAVVLFVLGARRGNSMLIYAAGILAGFGLLFNIVARAAMAVILLYALSHSDVRRRLAGLWPWALGCLLAALPVLLVNRGLVFSGALTKIVSPGSQHASEYSSILDSMLGNVSQNLIAFNYNPDASHYVSGSLLDPVSAALAVLGVGYALGSARRASSRLMLIMAAILVTGTALLSPYPYVPITRMHSIILPLALMAGVVAARFVSGELLLSGRIRNILHRKRTVALMVILGAVMLALNVWQFWYATPRIFHHTQEAVAIGAMRSDACEGEPDSVIMVGRHTLPLLKPALESYHTDGLLPHLIDHDKIAPNQPLPVEEPRCVIFLNPDAEEIQSFKQDLSARYPEGRFSAFSSPSGKASVEVFMPGAG